MLQNQEMRLESLSVAATMDLHNPSVQYTSAKKNFGHNGGNRAEFSGRCYGKGGHGGHTNNKPTCQV